ncbi:MAG: hypothetical protein ABI378_07475 [Chitinophagaceae bacterium]
MALRPIKPEERALIERLLSFVKDGNRYKIPQEVENLGEPGSGSLQLSAKGEHANDLVEADYKDADGRDVLITLSTNQFGELYDLDLWKSDFSSLQLYPKADKVKLST